jgi:hypothetical protein
MFIMVNTIKSKAVNAVKWSGVERPAVCHGSVE